MLRPTLRDERRGVRGPAGVQKMYDRRDNENNKENACLSAPKDAQESKPKDPLKKVKTARSSVLCATPPNSIRDHRSGTQYLRGPCIGEGGFARCFQVSDDKLETFAAKVISKKSLTSEKTKAKLFGEIKVHQNMQHSNIVRFVECFEDDANIYLVLEICANKSLMDMIRARKQLTEPEVRIILIQILGALKYMHSKRVIHRDLKLGNILLDENMNVKLGDFGLAALLVSEDERKMTICGTPNYIAPEILFGKEIGHSFEVDIWSVGVVVYALLFGKPPFQDKDVKIIYKRIKSGEFVFPESSDVSEEARDLIRQLLTQDPLSRPSIDKIAEHKFFQVGVMPLSIPVHALYQEPRWPSRMDKRTYTCNFDTIAINAGIGYGRFSGLKPNRMMSLQMEHGSKQEANRLLPDVLSPRNRPTPTMRPRVERPTSFNTRMERDAVDRSRSSSRQSQSSKESHSRPLSRNSVTSKREPDIRSNTRNITPVLTQTSTGRAFQKAVTQLEKATYTGKVHTATRAPRAPRNIEYPYIQKWIDYSNKYGLGYELSDGTVGILFNDKSSILISRTGQDIKYIESSSEPHCEKFALFKKDDCPPNLSNKMYLLNHFRKFMSKGSETVAASSRINSFWEPNVVLVHYHRTEGAIVFRLNEGTTQLNMSDHRKLSIHTTDEMFQYVDQSRKRHVWSVDRALQLHDYDDFEKRLDFAKHVLESWLTNS